MTGSMHDSNIALWSGMYTALEHIYDNYGYRIVGDSAFTQLNCPAIIKSYQLNRNGNLMATPLQREATSLRQSAEWGMRALQSSFPRLKDKIRWEMRGERKWIMKCAVYLYNFWVMTVGQNQIRSVFMPWLELEATRYAIGGYGVTDSEDNNSEEASEDE